MISTTSLWGKLKSVFKPESITPEPVTEEMFKETINDCGIEEKYIPLECSLETLEEVSFKVFMLNSCKNKNDENPEIFVGEFFKFLNYLKLLTLKDFDWEEKFVQELYDHQGNDIINDQTVYEIFESNIGLTVYSIGDNYGIMFDKYNITLDAYVTTELFSNGYQLDQGMITFKDLIAYFDDIY